MAACEESMEAIWFRKLLIDLEVVLNMDKPIDLWIKRCISSALGQVGDYLDICLKACDVFILFISTNKEFFY